MDKSNEYDILDRQANGEADYQFSRGVDSAIDRENATYLAIPEAERQAELDAQAARAAGMGYLRLVNPAAARAEYDAYAERLRTALDEWTAA